MQTLGLIVGAIAVLLLGVFAGYAWQRRKGPGPVAKRDKAKGPSPEPARPSSAGLASIELEFEPALTEAAETPSLSDVPVVDTAGHAQSGRSGQKSRAIGTLGYLILNEPLLAAPSRFSITNGVFRIGRSSDNDLSVKDPSVSRHHAEIHMHRNGAFSVKDLNSMNGVYVNDERVTMSALGEGDKLELGDLSLTFTFRIEPSGEETLILPAQGEDSLVDFEFDDKGAA